WLVKHLSKQLYCVSEDLALSLLSNLRDLHFLDEFNDSFSTKNDIVDDWESRVFLGVYFSQGWNEAKAFSKIVLQLGQADRSQLFSKLLGQSIQTGISIAVTRNALYKV